MPLNSCFQTPWWCTWQFLTRTLLVIQQRRHTPPDRLPLSLAIAFLATLPCIINVLPCLTGVGPQENQHY